VVNQDERARNARPEHRRLASEGIPSSLWRHQRLATALCDFQRLAGTGKNLPDPGKIIRFLAVVMKRKQKRILQVDRKALDRASRLGDLSGPYPHSFYRRFTIRVVCTHRNSLPSKEMWGSANRPWPRAAIPTSRGAERGANAFGGAEVRAKSREYVDCRSSRKKVAEARPISETDRRENTAMVFR